MFCTSFSTALWTKYAIIYLYGVSAVHPLAAAVAERRKLLGAGMTKRIPAEKDALRDWFALAAAGAYKIIWRHCFPSFSLYIDNISTKNELIRYFSRFQFKYHMQICHRLPFPVPANRDWVNAAFALKLHQRSALRE